MEIRFDRITPGIQKYTKLMQWVLETDVSRDMDFQRFYNGFYRMRQRNSAFYTSYYQFFEENKHNQQLTFEDILHYLYGQTGQIHASFSSKMLATIRPEMPLWDKFVLQNLSLRAPYPYEKNRFEKVVQLYNYIIQWYSTEETQNYLAIFNQHYPDAVMTDTKKIDWILWGVQEK